MRRSCTVETAAAVAAEVRALVPAAASAAPEVAEIVAAVATRGDEAVLEYERRFAKPSERCQAPLGGLRVSADRLGVALEGLDPEVRAGLELAVANVSAVAAAG